MDFARSQDRSLPEGTCFAAALVAIVLIGGAGRGYPVLQAIVEAVSIMVLAATWACHGFGSGRQRDWLATGVMAVAVAVPVSQLIPIPFATWAALPGHSLPASVLETAGIAPGAMPLTLDPTATRQAILGLLPGLALFVAGRSLSPDGRTLAIRTVLALAAISACLGAVQVVMGSTAASPAFASAHFGQGIGLFVNRNHQATFLLIGLCLCATLLRGKDSRPAERQNAWLALGLMVLLAAGVLATTSRTALALLPLAALPAALQLRRRRKLGALVATGLLALFAAWAWWSGALSRVIARLQDEPDIRLTFWRTSWQTLGEYWPVGSGIGSFRSVYRLFEDREDLVPIFVNHAHNDYLELLLEGGVVALAGMLLFAAWYGRGVWRAWRGPRSADTATLWALAMVLCFSAVEYPLRTLSIMALFGLLCGLTGPAPATSPSPLRWRGGATLAAGTAAALAIIFVGIDRNPPPPTNAAQANAVLSRSPLDQHAVAVLALSVQEEDPERAGRLMQRAASLGWRDPLAQLWLFGQNADEGRYAEAVAHAGALLSTGQQTPALLATMRQGSADPAFRAALAQALAAQPRWRPLYLKALKDLTSADVAPHAELLRDLARSAAPPKLDETGLFISRAIALGDAATAAGLWRTTSGTTPPNLLPDPRFYRIDSDGAARNGVFGWHRTEIEGLTADSDDATVLTVEQSSVGTLLYQRLLLAPGAYRLSLPFTVEDGTPAVGLGWTMTCAGPDNRRLDAASDATVSGARWTASFVVPADCPVQRLGLRSDGSGLASIRLRLGTAALTAENPASTAAP